MVGSATLTTVPSRNATPEPSTVASSTQRPASPAAGAQVRPQLRAADLAAHRLRQLRHEMDLPRVLVRRGDPLDVVLQLDGELVRAGVAGSEDDERRHDLRPLRVVAANN